MSDKEVSEIVSDFLGEYHQHKCPAHQGEGCVNCRGTGMNQTPCKMCDKDGIAFERRNEFEQAIQELLVKARLEGGIISVSHLMDWTNLHNLDLEQVLDGIQHMRASIKMQLSGEIEPEPHWKQPLQQSLKPSKERSE